MSFRLWVEVIASKGREHEVVCVGFGPVFSSGTTVTQKKNIFVVKT